MNPPKHLFRRSAVVFTLLAGIVLVPAGRAQPAAQGGNSRYLFIFNTSADMKKRLPAVQAEVDQLLATSLGGRLQPGDSVGVWTFDQDLHSGLFPLQFWSPENAVGTAAGINKFIGKLRYANRTRFDALQPQLNQVIQNSPRLTVLVFCDGEDEIKGTPYDASINQVFQQRQAAQKKAAEPFVIVLRTQHGQYIGCTMNFPPGMVNVPEFPPLPAPPPPPAAVTAPPPAPAVAPPPTGPPLIIIGKNVVTNWPPAPAPFPATNAVPAMPAGVVPAPVTNPIAPPLPVNPMPAVQTSAAPAAPAVAPDNAMAEPAIQTKAVAPPPANAEPAPAPTPPTSPATVTNAVVPPPEDTGPGRKHILVIGGALVVVAFALAAVAVFRYRRPDRGSLITRSMRKD